MSDHVIDITPEGAVQSLYHDGFPLGFLGTQNVHRASDIRHNNQNDTWAIHLAKPDGTFVDRPATVLSGFETYEAARKYEVKFLNKARQLGMCPIQHAYDINFLLY